MIATAAHLRGLGLQPEEGARWLAWEGLVQNVSDLLRVDHAVARSAAMTIPPNLVPMLDCPEGIAALGGFIMGALGNNSAAPPLPAIH
jgi:hypothetical protein